MEGDGEGVWRAGRVGRSLGAVMIAWDRERLLPACQVTHRREFECLSPRGPARTTSTLPPGLPPTHPTPHPQLRGPQRPRLPPLPPVFAGPGHHLCHRPRTGRRCAGLGGGIAAAAVITAPCGCRTAAGWGCRAFGLVGSKGCCACTSWLWPLLACRLCTQNALCPALPCLRRPAQARWGGGGTRMASTSRRSTPSQTSSPVPSTW